MQEFEKPTLMSWRSTFNLIKELSGYIFARSQKKLVDVEVVEEALLLRAWVLHIAVMVSRVLYPLLGVAYWQKAYKNTEERDDINHEFVRDSENIIKFATCVMIVVGVVLDILIWRKRKLANILFLYEIIYCFVYGFVPLDFGHMSSVFQIMILSCNYMIYSCDFGNNVIVNFLACPIITLGIFPFVFKD